MIFDYVIFDFDGTLADDSKLLISKLREISDRELKTKLTDDQIQSYRSLGASDLFKKLKLPLHKLPSITLEIQEYMTKIISEIRLKEGMKDVIDKLSNNYKLGILSSNSHNLIINFLDREGLLDKFEFVEECSKILGKADCIKKVTKKLKNDKVIYIGDEIRDIEAMRKAKVEVVSVSWGFNNRDSLVNLNPGRVADTPEQLLDLLS